MSSHIKIGFLGSGDIAVPVLDALLHAPDIDVLFVNTQPDRAAGRKNVLTPTPVGSFAAQSEIPLYKLNVNSEEFHSLLQDCAVDTLVVIDFGQLLKKRVLEFPPAGCINIHASILPKYRGASPIQSVLLHNEKETGITYMAMDVGLDTGDVYHCVPYPLSDEIHAEELLSELGKLAAETVSESLSKIVHGEYARLPQVHENASHCKKIKREDGLLDWSCSALTLECKCRAYAPWPGLWFILATGKKHVRVRITRCKALLEPVKNAPGTLLDIEKNAITVACAEGVLRILKLVPEGKNEMNASDFLRGTPLKIGDLLKTVTP